MSQQIKSLFSQQFPIFFKKWIKKLIKSIHYTNVNVIFFIGFNHSYLKLITGFTGDKTNGKIRA